MNNDLISREALKKAFEDCAGECACCIHNTNDFNYCGLIDNAPTISPFKVIGDFIESTNEEKGGADLRGDTEFTSVSTGYSTYTAEDKRTCDNCKHISGLPSKNGTMEYSGACKNCIAKDKWEQKGGAV